MSLTYTEKNNTSTNPFFVTEEHFPKWQNDDDYRMKEGELKKLVEFVNRCLCVYWKSLKSVNGQENKATMGKMRLELDKLASEGWGPGGGDDLNEALGRLEVYGKWKDDDLSRYMGGSGKLYNKNCWAPDAFVNFADAFDKKMSQLKADFREHKKMVDAVTADADAGSWFAAKEKLAKINAIASKVKDYGWLLDAGAIGQSQATRDFMAKTGKYLGVGAGAAGSFVSITGRIDATLTMYQKMKAQLGNQAGAEEAAEVLAGLRFVIEFVPVIGSFYGAMLDAIPGTVGAWNNGYIAHLKRAGMARDNIAMYNKMQSEMQKKHCGLCNKSVMNPCA